MTGPDEGLQMLGTIKRWQFLNLEEARKAVKQKEPKRKQIYMTLSRRRGRVYLLDLVW